MQRITRSNVEGAFNRLRRAMCWPDTPSYTKDENGQYRANVGAVELAESGYGWDIHIIDNESGGVRAPFSGWATKRGAFEGMAAMAQAVELYKQQLKETCEKAGH